MRLLFVFSFILLLSACAGIEKPAPEEAPLVLRPSNFQTLPGWGQDNLSEAVPALIKSCARIWKAPAEEKFSALPEAGTYKSWQFICNDLQSLTDYNNATLQAFFERHFMPYEASAAGQTKGLFTGYYEAGLRGSRTKHGPYIYPLYTRPDDLVMVDLGEFREELKGQRIAGRVNDVKQLKPYEDRAAIVAGNWPHNDKVLVWVDDPVDAFFVQVQGSGVVELDDGGVMRIGYAGQNGHIYYAIGRELIKRGYLTKEDVSMQAIRAWLQSRPQEADEVMNTNRSYVFFQEIEGAGPMGGEGVALTAGRSLAIDRSKIPYGLPVWVDITPPEGARLNLQRLMVAQDTGGAIRGAVRGDFFWGYGAEAEQLAGHMKSQGRYWFLLPRQ